MDLSAALAKHLTDNISGLYAFADELAHLEAGSPYPWVRVLEVSNNEAPLGCGVWDDQGEKTDGKRYVWKAIESEVVVRFTVYAISTSTASGNNTLNTVCKQIDRALFELSREKRDLQIPGNTDTVHVRDIFPAGKQPLEPSTKGAPFVFRKALSYRVYITVLRDMEDDYTFDEIETVITPEQA